MIRKAAIATAIIAGVSVPLAADGNDLAKSVLTGVWSFDRSCASGDGMGLKPDGRAWFDENSDGLWAEADGGKRLVLILQAIDPLDDSRGETVLRELSIDSVDSKSLKGTFTDGRRIDALRCPAT